jgi:hypothetical protein
MIPRRSKARRNFINTKQKAVETAGTKANVVRWA